jgi:uncharacterized protein (TIGR00251 family)
MKIAIKVKPNSSKSEIIKEGEEYVAYLKARPDKGKANEELLKLAKKYFKKQVTIKSGHTSRKKILEF